MPALLRAALSHAGPAPCGPVPCRAGCPRGWFLVRSPVMRWLGAGRAGRRVVGRGQRAVGALRSVDERRAVAVATVTWAFLAMLGTEIALRVMPLPELARRLGFELGPQLPYPAPGTQWSSRPSGPPSSSGPPSPPGPPSPSGPPSSSGPLPSPVAVSPSPVAVSPGPVAVSPGQARRLRALAVASRHWPPRGQACLRHALAVAVVLHRHHRCVIHLGVAPVSSTAPASSTVSAHAWVTVDGADLTGQGPFLALALGVGERTGASTTRS